MSSLKDGINDLFIFDEKKKESKSLSIFIYIFLVVLSAALIFYGLMSVKLMKQKEPDTFNKDVINNQYVSLTVNKVYSPCGYSASWWKVTGYYCIAETSECAYCIIYVDSDSWENGELGEFFTDDSKIGCSLNVRDRNYDGATSSLDSSYGSNALKYYKLYIDKACNLADSDYADIFTNYYVYPGDNSYLLIAWSILVFGCILLFASLFVGFMALKNKKR